MMKRPAIRLHSIAVLSLAIGCFAFGQTYNIMTFAGGGVPENTAGAPANVGTVSGVAVDADGNVVMALPDYHIVARLDVTTGILTRVAGNWTPGLSGDNGPATSAQLYSPSGIAIDAAGSLYIADLGSVVRKVTNGIITTVAGNGTPGFSGDGGPATNAQLNAPHGVAVDAAFNLFIADTGNSRIREISNGVITTVVGNGGQGFGCDDGPAASAHLFLPSGIAVDLTGNLFVADTHNHCVRRVSSGVITTIAGTGQGFGPVGDNGPATSAELSLPEGVFVDSDGNLYLADYLDQRVRKVSNGVISTVTGNGQAGFTGDGGPAVGAQLNGPSGVAVDRRGNIYIADSKNFRVRKVNGGTITTAVGAGSGGFAGDGGPASSAQLNNPSGVAMDSRGNLFIVDSKNHCVRMISNGSITTVAGNGVAGLSGDGGPATNAQLNSPLGIAVDAASNLYIADTGNNVVRKVTNGVITTVAGNGTSGSTGDNGPATSAELQSPNAVAVDAAGNLYMAVSYQCRPLSIFGDSFTVDRGTIREVSNGMITTVAGRGSSNFCGSFGYIGGMAVDSSGSLFIADRDFSSILKFTNGNFVTIAGTGSAGFGGDNGPAASAQLANPYGISVDAAGVVWIADTGNQRIRTISKGVIATVAGTGPPALPGLPQFGGDGGPATSALLNNPQAIVTDVSGDAFFADTGNNRIRVLIPSDQCASSVEINADQIGASGGNLTVGIQTGPSCQWTISGLPQWMTVAGTTSGSGSATITLVVEANTGSLRTVTFPIAGTNITVMQAAATYSVSGQITFGGKPLAGVVVSFAGLTTPQINPTYMSTDAEGNYSFSFPATSGTFTITASLKGYSFIPASSQVLGFTNNTASFAAFLQPQITGLHPAFGSLQPAPQSFAPGGIVSISGTQLCTGVGVANPVLPKSLAGCMAYLDGTPLALYYGSPDQIEAILPQDSVPGDHQLFVWRYTDSSHTNLAFSDAFSIVIGSVSMSFVERTDNGNALLAAQYSDGGFAGSTRPLTPGDVITLYLTGLGAKVQVFAEGSPPRTMAASIAPVVILVEGNPAQISYAGVQPQDPGLDEIVLELPQYTLPPGKHTATLEISVPSVGQTVRYEVNSH